MDESAVEPVLRERIVRIEKAVLRGTRPRSIGYNARIPTHGPHLRDLVVRVHTSGGAVGLGWSNIRFDQAENLIGRELRECFQWPDGVLEPGRCMDLPLWDLVARAMELPLYRLLGGRGRRRVEIYDGSIYIDDLEASDREAERIFTEEVASGQEHGYRHFKVKVGRGARWMTPEAGLHRDALVVHAVRAAAGDAAKIMIDANMGNTLNSAQALLQACAGARIHWFEEPFHEDRPLNLALKQFIVDHGWNTLVADGEFAPPLYFFDLVQEGLIDVVQHDFRMAGLTWWRGTAARLESWGVLCGPHAWGSCIERFHHAHFAAAIPNYALLEAAPVRVPGLVTDGWQIIEGCLVVPDTPGAGFDVEADVLAKGLRDSDGFSVAL